MRRLKNFSRKRPVTAQRSLVLIAANTVSRRITETRARERARNSYIRDDEQRHAHSRIRIDHEGAGPQTAVPAAWARAGGDVRAWLPTIGGPVDYADGGIGCREPGDSFGGEGAARRCPGRCPRRPGHIGRGHWVRSAGIRRRLARLDLGWGRPASRQRADPGSRMIVDRNRLCRIFLDGYDCHASRVTGAGAHNPRTTHRRQ